MSIVDLKNILKDKQKMQGFMSNQTPFEIIISGSHSMDYSLTPTELKPSIHLSHTYFYK